MRVIFIRKSYILFSFVCMFLACSIHSIAQEGLQLHLSSSLGLSYMAPQNHYDNDHYHLSYKNKLSYNIETEVGYGFNKTGALLVGIGYQKFNNSYQGEFNPGLGVLTQYHKKNISLDYLSLNLVARFANSFSDAYVYDNKVQFFVATGFAANFLLNAATTYYSNDEEVSYPDKLIPYTDTNYLYQPVSDAKQLYTNFNLMFLLEAGIDVFISDKFAFRTSISGRASVLDVNQKDYRKHDKYKASRVYFGGLKLGLSYYISR